MTMTERRRRLSKRSGKKGPQGCNAAVPRLQSTCRKDRPDLSAAACQFARKMQYNWESVKRACADV